MHLFTCDSFNGEIKECDEGVLQWIPKDEIFTLSLWEGDKIFLKLLFEDTPFFTLKLVYKNENLIDYNVNIYER